MMSPQMIQDVLLASKWTENKISENVILPCLVAYSTRHGHPLKNVRFVGGTSEEGNDLEYYELIGPDSFRIYTGIQVKKGNITPDLSETLSNQGSRALCKRIFDPSNGQSYRVSRWIVASTGAITSQARGEIDTRLEDTGKPIHYWDGIDLGTLILKYSYDQFVKAMDVPATTSASQNVREYTILPKKILERLNSTDFVSINIGGSVPCTAHWILLAVEPADGNDTPVDCHIRSAAGDVILNSMRSQALASHLAVQGSMIEAKILDPSRSVNVILKGWLDIL